MTAGYDDETWTELSTLDRYLETVDDLTVISGVARLLERSAERGEPVSPEDLRRNMALILEAARRIARRL